MLIRGWRLNKKLKTTLPTHPQGKTFRLISFLVPVISRETLPLRGSNLENVKKKKIFLGMDLMIL
jgi:hypothetical protein